MDTPSLLHIRSNKILTSSLHTGKLSSLGVLTQIRDSCLIENVEEQPREPSVFYLDHLWD